MPHARLVLFVLLAFSGSLLAPAVLAQDEPEGSPDPEVVEDEPFDDEVFEDETLSDEELAEADRLDDVFAQLADSYVEVEPGDGSLHSAVLVSPTRVVGAGHCLVGRVGQRVVVHLPDAEVSGRVVAARRDPDLSLVALDHADHGGVPIALAARGEDLARGEEIFAMGRPDGETVGLAGAYRRADRDHLVLHLDLAPGASGGPLICEAGRLHGVLVASRGRDGLAVPVEAVRALLENPDAPSAAREAPRRVRVRARPRPRRAPAPLVAPARPEPLIEPAPAPSSAARGVEALVFGAAWCPACRATNAWLQRRGIRFRERDHRRLSQEPDAPRARGIPVTRVTGPGGTRWVRGFDADGLRAAVDAVAR